MIKMAYYNPYNPDDHRDFGSYIITNRETGEEFEEFSRVHDHHGQPYIYRESYDVFVFSPLMDALDRITISDIEYCLGRREWSVCKQKMTIIDATEDTIRAYSSFEVGQIIHSKNGPHIFCGRFHKTTNYRVYIGIGFNGEFDDIPLYFSGYYNSSEILFIDENHLPFYTFTPFQAVRWADPEEMPYDFGRKRTSRKKSVQSRRPKKKSVRPKKKSVRSKKKSVQSRKKSVQSRKKSVQSRKKSVRSKKKSVRSKKKSVEKK